MNTPETMQSVVSAGGYAGTFTHPVGGGTVTAIEFNTPENTAQSAAELAYFKAEKPDAQLCYVDETRGLVTTFMGDVLGHIQYCRTYHGTFGRMQSVRFMGVNGCEYYGRKSADWADCMWAHKAKHHE